MVLKFRSMKNDAEQEESRSGQQRMIADNMGGQNLSEIEDRRAPPDIQRVERGNELCGPPPGRPYLLTCSAPRSPIKHEA